MLAHASRDKLLYLCTHADGSRTVVQYTTSYSVALHQQLAAADLAPKLIRYEQLPAGWLCETMEYLGLPWVCLDVVLEEGDQEQIASATAAAEEGIERLHKLPGGPWVWGDARPPNIYVKW